MPLEGPPHGLDSMEIRMPMGAVVLPLQRPPLPVRRFTVAEYRRLAEVGILGEHERVELLEGWIVPKRVHNPPHDNAVELVDEALRARLPPGWRVRVQSSITTADSEPEPDLILVRGSARDRKGRHPNPSEVGLIVEVADSSLETDRRDKARLYARASIPCYWIVNLVDRCVEVHAQPAQVDGVPRYRRVETRSAGQSVELVLDERPVATLAVDELLP